MANIQDWSATAGSNSTVGGINIAEGMSPALVNDAIRAAMSIIKQSVDASLQNFLTNTAALPIANGGTGAATAANALIALGALSSAYQDLPFVAKSAAFTFDNTLRGCAINYTGAAAAATINPQSSTTINVGAVFVIRNGGSGALTVTRGAGVLLQPNGAASKDVAIAVGGVATLINWGSDTWTISGSSLS